MKFYVSAGVTGSVWIGEFEAETEEEAIQKALSIGVSGPCHQCSKHWQDLDIDAENIVAEPAEE